MKKLMALLVVSGMVFFACNNQPKEEEAAVAEEAVAEEQVEATVEEASVAEAVPAEEAQAAEEAPVTE
ncbi:MAG TPA: hypothetical protein PLF32_00690 [Bacteroidales bacterium]|nr:hypothetical protein [Bacteroidales bacterium]HON20423.1 hypothetical protein [Bacteroidales bacterium]HOR81155.1 hypothetical protein [Bacteroidales bacterium]HPJ90723.1 hypothetical protein [Bacteroidales bacterium]HQB19101.1 hypothetical protein [Bacteroidales bacterium]